MVNQFLAGPYHGIEGYYLCLAILTNDEECHISRRTNVHMCYDYVHLDTLSDISAYRTVVKPAIVQQYKMEII